MVGGDVHLRRDWTTRMTPSLLGSHTKPLVDFHDIGKTLISMSDDDEQIFGSTCFHEWLWCLVESENAVIQMVNDSGPLLVKSMKQWLGGLWHY